MGEGGRGYYVVGILRFGLVRGGGAAGDSKPLPIAKGDLGNNGTHF